MSELIFEWGANLIETFIIIDFMTKYLGCKFDDNRKTVGFICGWFAAFTELCIVNHITAFEGFASVIPIVIYLMYAVFCLNGDVFLKLWISVFTQIIVMVIAVLTNLFVCNIIGYDPNAMISVFNSIRVISVIITKIILFYVTRIILRNKYKNPLDKHFWVLLLLIPAISLISVSALMLAVLDHEEIRTYILLGVGCIVIANGVTYYFFTVLNKEHETKLKIKFLEQENANAKKNIEQADVFVQQMKSVRHDVKNQLLIIYNNINSGKYEEAKEYIRNLTQNHLPNIQSYINTGNNAFDAIVNSKIAICNQKNIYIIVKVMKDSLNGFDAIDTGVLFGNLLDNAIEAADKTSGRRIIVDIQHQSAYLSILIRNSINESVLEKNPQLNTSKNDTELHGIGTKNIGLIVKKYDGMLQYFEENQEFCCHILVNTNK